MTKIRPGSGLSRAEVIADQRRRLLDGFVLALSDLGYDETRTTDIVELAGVSCPTFYEHFEGKEECFAAAYADGLGRLEGAIEVAAERGQDWVSRVSAGLRAGLDFLAADPPLAHLLLVESLAAARPTRLEHERTLVRLAEALRPARGDVGRWAMPKETGCLLAGGLASHLSGRALAGEAARLPDSFDLLLVYLLTPPVPATASSAGERRA